MTNEDYKKFYERVVSNPHMMVYLTLQDKLNQTCKSFDEIEIDVTSEDDTFKNLLAFSKTIKSILDDMEEIRGKLDPEQQAQVKEKQRKAGVGSVEDMVNKIAMRSK